MNTSQDDGAIKATSQPLFAVVVQNYEASVSDQLSMERGQVVESLFSQENWIYIRNVDGQCGYVPSEFCFPLEQLRMGLPDDKNDHVRRIRAHPRPTTIHVDTFGYPVREAVDEGRGAVGGDGEEEEVVNSPDSGISCSQQASSSNMESVQSFHNIRERLTAGSRNTQPQEAGPSRGHTHVRHKRFFDPNTSLPVLETVTLPGNGLHHNTGGDVSHSPSPPPLLPVNLADLRQRKEMITNTEQTSQPLHRASEAMASEDYDEQHSPTSDTDDVFLPEAKKPAGIYQCSETYVPTCEGEMPLQRDEVVVVMEVGRGEWVWAVGTENKEGLVPKSLLHKYRPDVPEESEEFEEEEDDMGEEREVSGDRGEEETMVTRNERSLAAAGADTVTSATQTELIINGVVWEIRPSLPTGQRTANTQSRDTATVSIQTEFTSPTWFKNNTPTPTPNNTLPRSTSISTTPHMHQDHTSHTNPTAVSTAAATAAQPKLLCAPRSSHTASYSQYSHQRPVPSTRNPEPISSTSSPNPRSHTERSIPRSSNSVQSPSTNARRHVHLDSSPSAPAATSTTENVSGGSITMPQVTGQHPGGTATGEGGQPRLSQGHLPVVSSGTGTIQRHRQALRQHVRIVNSIQFEPDNEAATNSAQSTAATRRRVQPTPIMTALRDYVPPRQAKNAFALRKGDIMYAQPHVPYPHGWVWVYHTVLKKYGYVPKDYIAYMYLVQRDQGTVLEDVV